MALGYACGDGEPLYVGAGAGSAGAGAVGGEAGSAPIPVYEQDDPNLVSGEVVDAGLLDTEIPVTGDWQTWQDVTVSITDPGGSHKYCFLFERNPGDELLFNLNYIDFIGTGVGH